MPKTGSVFDLIKDDMEKVLSARKAIGENVDNELENIKEITETEHIIMREKDGEVRGLIVYSENEDSLRPLIIYINEKDRKSFQGASTIISMYDELIKRAKDERKKSIDAFVSKVEYPTAKFYMNRGFEITPSGQFKFYVKKEVN